MELRKYSPERDFDLMVMCDMTDYFNLKQEATEIFGT